MFPWLVIGKKKLESFLRREIAAVMSSELRDPRLGFITISRVEMSPDLSSVTCYYTMLGVEQKVP